VKSAGAEPEQIVGWLNNLKNFEDNSLKNGAFKLAPGYGT